MKLLVIATLLLLTEALARAEQVEIVTYYPSPAATTDDLRVKRRVTVGPTYRDLKLDDSLATIPDGTLLVEQSVGIGAPVPFATTVDKTGKSPKNGLLGNLDVNDIWIRSAQAWASTLGSGAEPSKPYKVVMAVPLGGNMNIYPASLGGSSNQSMGISVAAHDVYAALQLWRYGVQPDQITITSWRWLDWQGYLQGDGSWSPDGGSRIFPPPFTGGWYGAGNIPSRSSPVGVRGPFVYSGTIYVESENYGAGLLEVDVTW